MKNQDSNNEMQNNSENPFETLIKAYPEYKENKEKFKEKYPSIYITMEAVEKKAEEDIEQEYIRRNMVFNYSLKKHFGLLTKEEIQRQIEVHYCPVKIGSLIYNKLVINTLQRLNF